MSFNLKKCIETAWQDVHSIYLKGLIPNENVCNFCLCKSIHNQLPQNINLTFDSRVTEQPLYRADLIIWKEGIERTALFVGEMKFWPQYNGKNDLWKVEQDLEKLQTISQIHSLDFLTIDPSTGFYDEIPAQVTNQTQFGFFVTARNDSEALNLSYLKQFIDKETAQRFHFATGTIFNDNSIVPIFNYFGPST